MGWGRYLNRSVERTRNVIRILTPADSAPMISLKELRQIFCQFIFKYCSAGKRSVVFSVTEPLHTVYTRA